MINPRPHPPDAETHVTSASASLRDSTTSSRATRRCSTGEVVEPLQHADVPGPQVAPRRVVVRQQEDVEAALKEGSQHVNRQQLRIAPPSR